MSRREIPRWASLAADIWDNRRACQACSGSDRGNLACPPAGGGQQPLRFRAERHSL